MLLQYKVENYKSIRDEVIINFSVEKKYENTEWVIRNRNNNVSLYKCIGLVGPNASGKSNILESLIFSKNFILNTISRKENSKINIESFAFDDEMNDKPTSFEFIFIKDMIKYVYGFSINKKEVVYEYLMGYFSSKPKTLFDRSNGQNYDFKGNDVKKQKELSQKTNSNRLYMPVAAEWGYAPLKKVYDWFSFTTRQYEEFDIDKMISNIVDNDMWKNVLIDELKNADFNIKDIYVKNKKIDQKSYDFISKLVLEFIGDNKEVVIPEKRPIIYLVHENLNGKTYEIPLEEDSTGTKTIVSNIVELLSICDQGGLMIEDELGKTYHTRLTQHFLQMVKSSELNKGNAQLLFTTHNTKVLNMLNSDQIYLVDKDETGATTVQLLDDFVIRENDNIELGYLKGRYGAIPYMRN